jgi:TonB family protein
MRIMSRQCIGQIGRLALAAVCVLVVWGRPAPAHGAAEQIELPPYKAPLKDDYYPPDASMHHLQGRALVEFALNERGVPQDVVLVSSEPAHEFEDSALRLVKNLRFAVPSDWQRGTGAAAHRFRIGVRFQEIECLNISKCESQARNPPADYDSANRTYVVSTQRRVLSLHSTQSAAPAPASPLSQPPSPPPSTAPRPPANPAASAEPDYPPG